MPDNTSDKYSDKCLGELTLHEIMEYVATRAEQGMAFAAVVPDDNGSLVTMLRYTGPRATCLGLLRVAGMNVECEMMEMLTGCEMSGGSDMEELHGDENEDDPDND